MNKVDLLFIVDVTGSMGGFIQEAKTKMQSILESLTDKFKIDLKVGLSLYRDHPSQDDSFVTAVFDLDDMKETKKKIDEISVGGGGDTPEVVLDGIIDGVNSLSWRENSRRIAFLIGDAPAHGMLEDDCCLCGKTWGDAVAAAEAKKLVIYSIVLGRDRSATQNFKMLSNFTGGLLIENNDAMEAITSTLTEEFDNLNLDSKVLEMLSKDKDVDDICKMLNIDRDDITSSKARIAQYS